MRRSVRLQRCLARLVILVMLAAALFPALGHAFAAERTGAPFWMEVCTVGGVETREVSSGDSSPSGPALLVEHCPYCLVSSFDDRLPAQDTPVLTCAATAGLAPQPLPSGRSATVWLAAHPRAPPAVL